MQVELPHHVRLIPQEIESALRNAGIHANSLLEVRRMYNAVGIDVSKGKSTIAVLQPGGTVIRKPFDVSHTSQNLNELADYLGSLEGPSKIVMECTGRYHEPMLKVLYEAGLFVSVVNPHPFLTSVIAGRTVKEFIHTGISIIQQCNEVCLCGNLLLHKEAELRV